MCGQCAMVAAAGASGARVAIAHYFRFWMTPKRLRRITVALGCAALLGSTVTFGGTNVASQATAQSHPPERAGAR